MAARARPSTASATTARRPSSRSTSSRRRTTASGSSITSPAGARSRRSSRAEWRGPSPRAASPDLGHNDLMKRMSVAEAKAHFSELVADARRGKPAAAVVPAAAAEPAQKPPAATREQALALLESFAHLGDPSVDAVAELKAG